MSRTSSQTRAARTSFRSALRVGFAVSLALAVVASLTPSAAQADTFTLDPISPTLGIIPASAADLLNDVGPPAAIGIPAAAMGLIGLAPGDFVDAISDGFDPVGVPHTDYFSVTRFSVGAPGSGVFVESSILDTPPGVTPGHASDIFVTSPPLFGTNILAPAGFGWTPGTTTGDEAVAGLITPNIAAMPGDEVSAYDLATLAVSPVGIIPPVLFSLAAGSPTLLGLGATGADILGVGGIFGPLPTIVIPQALLGIPAGAAADVDALAFFGLPPGPYPIAGPLPPGVIEFSLTAATAPLLAASLGSGATIIGIGPGGVPFTAHTPFALGLLPTDELDALDVDQVIIPEPSSMALLGLGALALLGLAWRRSKRTA